MKPLITSSITIAHRGNGIHADDFDRIVTAVDTPTTVREVMMLWQDTTSLPSLALVLLPSEAINGMMRQIIALAKRHLTAETDRIHVHNHVYHASLHARHARGEPITYAETYHIELFNCQIGSPQATLNSAATLAACAIDRMLVEAPQTRDELRNIIATAIEEYFQ